MAERALEPSVRGRAKVVEGGLLEEGLEPSLVTRLRNWELFIVMAL